MRKKFSLKKYQDYSVGSCEPAGHGQQQQQQQQQSSRSKKRARSRSNSAPYLTETTKNDDSKFVLNKSFGLASSSLDRNSKKGTHTHTYSSCSKQKPSLSLTLKSIRSLSCLLLLHLLVYCKINVFFLFFFSHHKDHFRSNVCHSRRAKLDRASRKRSL